MNTSRFCCVLVFLLILQSCGGNSNDPPTSSACASQGLSPSAMPAAANGSGAPAPRLIRAGSEAALTQTLRTQLRNTCANESADRPDETSTGAVPAPAIGAPAAPVAGDSAARSGTNLQEAGVDESDRIKFDGTHLFIASPPVPEIRPLAGGDPPAGSHVRVMAVTENPPAATEVGRLTPSLPARAIQGLYLTQAAGSDTADQLAIIGLRYPDSGIVPPPPVILPPGDILPVPPVLPPEPGTPPSTVVTLFDIADSANMREIWNLEISGQYLRSRVVDDKLYLVTAQAVILNNFILAPATLEQQARNDALAEQIDSTQIMPVITINGGTPVPVDPAGCYIPAAQRNAPLRALPRLIMITEIDLRNPDLVQPTCTFTGATEVYASTRALYLIAHAYPDTRIHKFSFTEQGLQYRGSAELPGTLDGSRPSFRFGEFKDDLRVVTTLDGQTHRLYVLRESQNTPDTLDIIAELPDDRHPEPLGKPGERIYAVRFAGERAYVVTFKRVDPLYVIDLSDPFAPFIAGQLEIPGFSDYLHPLGNTLLIGVGKDAVEQDGTTWFQGIKVGLFDVTDPNTPQLRGEQRIGKRGSSTPLSRTHLAFTLVHDADLDRIRFAIPITVHDGPPQPDPAAFYPFSYQGLHEFEIANAGDGATAALTMVGVLKPGDAAGAFRSFGDERSVIQGDAVHFITTTEVWSARWSQPDSPTGPQ